MNELKHPIPLTPAVFYILLALAPGEQHGYAIMKQVKHDSNGQVTMGNGTLYGSIKRLLADHLIEEAGDHIDSQGDNERRRYYKLTPLGRHSLQAEMQRYADVISLLHQRGLMPNLSLHLSL